jgi:hypothetical protein
MPLAPATGSRAAYALSFLDLLLPALSLLAEPRSLAFLSGAKPIGRDKSLDRRTLCASPNSQTRQPTT